MLFTWLITSIFIGGFIATFYDEIKVWAEDLFNSLSGYIRKAWVYIRRIPGGIKQMIRYIQNGLMMEESQKKEVEWDEIVRMHENGDIDDETFNALKAERDKKIAEMSRDR